MPGISVSKICVPFGGGGINWSSYWATLISATVENSAPTNVVLTFPTAQPSLVASDFTIAGFTVSSGSWSGSVLTLVLSYAVTYYSGNLTITFGKTGETATVTNNVAIANTVGWYVSGDGSDTYVTKDGSDFVSVWKDLSGSSHPLNQATGTNQPKWESDGILFDGVDNFLKAGPFTCNQPIFIYLVFKQIIWNHRNQIFDGNTPDNVTLYQYTSAPSIMAYAGGTVILNGNLAINTFGVVRILYNGVSSKLIVDDTVPTLGNFGSNSLNGFTLGRGGGVVNFSNIKVKEIIIRSADDDAATEASIYAYLKNKYSL